MIAPHYPPGPAALAARWREDAQVLRRYGATSRARLLEQMAAELEASTAADAMAYGCTQHRRRTVRVRAHTCGG